jgi:CTP:molybdopterin cytidylyltransferase MocA/carbon monoxide dehydrogenase subunit G
VIIEDSFDIDAPLSRVWPLLSDIPRVANCLPGAAIEEQIDATTYRARATVKVGPVSVGYRATIVVLELDAEKHVARFDVRGDEVKGRGGVRATVTSSATDPRHAPFGRALERDHRHGRRPLDRERREENDRAVRNELGRRGVRLVCAILAAGRSSRMGAQKLLVAVEGVTLLERALGAAAGFPAVAVVAPSLAGHVGVRPGLTVVVNPEPERGMTRSLALADAAIADRDAALAVLLADTPFVDAALLARVAAALGHADVAYPVRDGRPGHPVVFGARPRAALAGWPEGDSLRALRDDPRWRRVEVPVKDDGPFLDVDTPSDLARAVDRARLEPPARTPGS